MSDSQRRRRRAMKPGQIARHRSDPPGTAVTAWHLRELFQTAKVLERATAGTLAFAAIERNHPAEPMAGEPVCTWSELIAYYDADNNRIATAHQYLRPDNTIGLRGRPDPKELIYNGVRYYVDIG
jgi:hypothetical protein